MIAVRAGDEGAARAALAPIRVGDDATWRAVWAADRPSCGAPSRAERRWALVMAGVWRAWGVALATAGPARRPAVDALATRALARCLAIAAGDIGGDGRWRLAGATVVARAVGGSVALGRHLIAHPGDASGLWQGVDAGRGGVALAAELAALAARHPHDEVAFAAGLRRIFAAHWARVVCLLVGRRGGGAARMRQLSDLAGALAEAACAWTRRSIPCEAVAFAVLAQGKLGARELNVSSDIDLQFLCADARGADGDDPAGTAVAVAHRVGHRLVTMLGEHPQAGPLYRIDLDLRPEGRRGALVNTVAGAEHYYETWGQSWERLALLRARHLAGDAGVCGALLAAVRPFVAPRSPDQALVEEIRAIKDRLVDESRAGQRQRRDPGGIDVKRDAGGIREVELFVQTYQVLHGGHRPNLVTASLLDGLAAVAAARLVPARACRQLRAAYLRLRRVENFLQAAEGRQTHRLPETLAARAELAAWLGLADDDDVVAYVRRTQARVRRLTRALFGPTPRVRGEARAARALIYADGPRRRAGLAAWGFADPGEADAQLSAMARHVGGPLSSHARDPVRSLAPLLLAQMRHCPDPAMALRLWGRLEPLLCRHPIYLRLLHDAPPVRRRLLQLLGTSAHLGNILIACPELIDELAAPPAGRRAVAPPAAAAPAIAATLAGAAADRERGMEAICRAKLVAQLHIGLDDLAGTLPARALQARLSAVAEACLAATWRLAGELGGASPPAMTVLALGRLGAREMAFGSDLDLLFVAHDGGPVAGEAVRRVQRFIELITAQTRLGRCYPVDLRLRPSGSQGPLVVSAAALLDYHARHRALWEAQAMLRARPVAGCLAAGEALLGELLAMPPPGGLGADAVVAQVTAMRDQLVATGRARGADGVDIRLGGGALCDIEFFVQGHQLAHAWRRPELRAGHTLAAVRALADAGLMARRRAALLAAAWRFLRRVEHGLRMLDDRPTTRLPAAGPALTALARRLGTSEGRLSEDVARTMARVRRLTTQPPASR